MDVTKLKAKLTAKNIFFVFLLILTLFTQYLYGYYRGSKETADHHIVWKALEMAYMNKLTEGKITPSEFKNHLRNGVEDGIESAKYIQDFSALSTTIQRYINHNIMTLNVSEMLKKDRDQIDLTY